MSETAGVRRTHVTDTTHISYRKDYAAEARNLHPTMRKRVTGRDPYVPPPVVKRTPKGA